jgi:Aminoglycoside-2''-adenylyltransferase
VTAFEPDVSKWDAWRPEEIARLFDGVHMPWYVAAGWALDLFAGEQRREHEDLEVAVPSSRFDELEPVLRAFDAFVITGPGEATPLVDARDRLMDTHQTWMREPETELWRFDVFREPSDGDTWICRREPSIRMPYARLIERTADGIPYGRPEVVLLFKAKHAHEEKNRRDFEATSPLLDAARRAWLRDALERVHAGHEWLGAL